MIVEKSDKEPKNKGWLECVEIYSLNFINVLIANIFYGKYIFSSQILTLYCLTDIFS